MPKRCFSDTTFENNSYHSLRPGAKRDVVSICCVQMFRNHYGTKDMCSEHYEKCIDQGGGKNIISVKSTCGRCSEYCTTYGFWPLAVYGKGGLREQCKGQ